MAAAFDMRIHEALNTKFRIRVNETESVEAELSISLNICVATTGTFSIVFRAPNECFLAGATPLRHDQRENSLCPGSDKPGRAGNLLRAVFNRLVRRAERRSMVSMREVTRRRSIPAEVYASRARRRWRWFRGVRKNERLSQLQFDAQTTHRSTFPGPVSKSFKKLEPSPALCFARRNEIRIWYITLLRNIVRPVSGLSLIRQLWKMQIESRTVTIWVEQYNHLRPYSKDWAFDLQEDGYNIS